tara:strand:+ start:1065 stop:1175 length:111 start_codon:yes stop_codon:yes gene_type:complete
MKKAICNAMTNEIAIVEAGIIYTLKLFVEYYTANLN